MVGTEGQGSLSNFFDISRTAYSRVGNSARVSVLCTVP